MAQDLSYERSDLVFFCTIRTIQSLLWFVNTPQFNDRVLAYLARYQERYGVIIYGFIIMGNHYHLIAAFPKRNKAAFFRDFNAIIPKLAKVHIKGFKGGKLWARRVRVQALPNGVDVKDRFFYAALNPVAAGLAEKISSYSGYNSFADASCDRRRTFRVVNWEDYNNRRRKNRNLTISECTSIHTLNYARLPGFEAMSKRDYASMLEAELEERRNTIVEKRLKNGQRFLPKDALRAQVPGAEPLTTKTSKRHSHRPLVLTLCSETRKQFLDWYFSLLERYRRASAKFRSEMLGAEFPEGTYRPPTFCSGTLT